MRGPRSRKAFPHYPRRRPAKGSIQVTRCCVPGLEVPSRRLWGKPRLRAKAGSRRRRPRARRISKPACGPPWPARLGVPTNAHQPPGAMPAHGTKPPPQLIGDFGPKLVSLERTAEAVRERAQAHLRSRKRAWWEDKARVKPTQNACRRRAPSAHRSSEMSPSMRSGDVR